jgi:phenylalanyl-tRNA synthetase beta chain
MKFSLSILKKYFNFNKDYTPNELAEIITNLGFEVEKIEDLSAQYKNFVTAKILEAKKHPESEKLTLCKVDNGVKTLNIVCGASNAREGINVVLANIGAIVPANGLEIKKGVIRGAESEGMLCSLKELCLGEEGEGILELPLNVKAGLELADYLGKKDYIFHISITPNRGDGASIKGILRDLHAKGLGRIEPLSMQNIILENTLKIEISSDVMPFIGSANFALAELGQNFQFEKERSLYDSIWAKSDLITVDISNFTMFLTGAPNHIYDADKITGKISLSRSIEGEVFVPIKGDEMKLPAGLIVLKDEEKILSLVGVMGDVRSKCTLETKNILIEALHIKPEEVIKSSRETKIKSESSYRFERGVDFSIQKDVLQFILSKIGVNSATSFHFNGSFETKKISITKQDYQAKIGVEISSDKMLEILTNLGFKPELKQNEIICTIPPFRYDVSIKDDLCEEIARINGYEAITPKPIANLQAIKNYDLGFEIKKILQRDLNEVITYSFFKNDFFGLFSDSSNKIELYNPITAELSVMRDSLIPNLLENVAKNEAKSYFDTAIFEVGTVFFGTKPEEQNLNFAGVFAGLNQEKTFLNQEKSFDIWHAKQKMLEALFEIWGFSENSFMFKSFVNNNLHTTQSFEVFMGKNKIGILAQIHPLTLDKFQIKQKVFIFEIYTQKLPLPKKKRSIFTEDILPDVNREIAIILSKNILFESILSVIKRLRISNIKDIMVKDLFEDEKRIGEGLKSISLQFKIKQDVKTLTKEEIDDDIINSIVFALSKEFNAKLRDGETAK